MSDARQIKPVKPGQWVQFQCRRCGACCRGLDDSIMLEPMDIYRLGRLLLERGGEITGPEDVLERYAHPAMLADRLPIFLLNTEGEDARCVFLKDGRCAVYEARPRVCRLYPFTVAPGDRGRDFLYCLCTERPHHFSGGMVSVGDWFYRNFSKDARAYLKADYAALPVLGRCIRSMGEERFKGMLFQFLFYRYYNYDLTKPFLPQFFSNLEKLKELTAEKTPHD